MMNGAQPEMQNLEETLTFTNRVLVWLADDLRLEDNLALSMAMRPPFSGFAVVRMHPEVRGRPQRTPHRRALEDCAEQHLHRELSRAGVTFEVLSGVDDLSLVRLCRKHHCGTVIRNAADGMPAERTCLRDITRELTAARIPLMTVNGEMIRRSGESGARPTEPFLSDDAVVDPKILASDHPISLLRAFLQTLPERGYRAGMWLPSRDRASTSLLSTHFAAGTLSSDRAELETTRAEARWKQDHPELTWTTEGASFRCFKGRVSFRRGFLTTFSRYDDKGPPPPTTAEQRNWAQAWREGRTGMPMPDAAMRELAATGWINFRLRQLAASYGIQLLRLPPHEVGDALAEMFDDYEPGITWMQVGINDGTVVPERGPRVLNPVKQGRDLDPDESYVRQWIPELATLPFGFGHEPWRHPNSPLPPPFVDHKVALLKARGAWGRKPSALQPRLI